MRARLYDAVMDVLNENRSLCLDDTMDRHRLAEALARDLRSGRSGWAAVRKDEVPKRRRLFPFGRSR